VFCDFGENFVIYDTDGERVEDMTVSELMIDKIDGVFQIYLGSKTTLPYSDGYLVHITDVKFSVQDNAQ